MLARVQLALLELAIRFVPRLPHHTVCVLARTMGRLACRVRRGFNRLLAEEIEQTFGTSLTRKQMQHITVRTSECGFMNRAEILLFPHLDAGRLARITHLHGRGYLDDALAQGAGAILLTAHFGSNKIFIPLMGVLGYRFSQVGVPPGNWVQQGIQPPPPIRRLLDLEADGERSWPVTFLDAFDARTPRQVRRRLKAGEVVCMAYDGAKRDRWVDVAFLERRMIVSPNAFRLARAAGAPVLPIVAVRGRDDRHHVCILPPLAYGGTGDRDEDARQGAQAMADTLARFVRRWPEQYARTMVARRRFAAADGMPLFQDRLQGDGQS
jgi:lauroyl/myristoyl acyltransferase